MTMLYSRTFYIKCTITIHDFMSWAVGTLRPFEIGSKQARSNRITYRKKHIPAPYDRILCQLIMEDRHGAVDRSHEAVRRQSYAQQVLDEFAKDFTSYEGEPIDFRSNVLSPILQRQLMGVSDAYLVSVRKAVGEGSDNPTIGQATRFYLEDDPTIPELIPNYRFNMVFIPQVRWHLGILMGVIQVGDHPGYKRVWDNQDYLMSAPPAECEPNLDGDQMPLFTPSMVTVIVDERLDLFFGPECGRVVCVLPFRCIPSLSMSDPSPSWFVKSGNAKKLGRKQPGSVLGPMVHPPQHRKPPILLVMWNLPQRDAAATRREAPLQKVRNHAFLHSMLIFIPSLTLCARR